MIVFSSLQISSGGAILQTITPPTINPGQKKWVWSAKNGHWQIPLLAFAEKRD